MKSHQPIKLGGNARTIRSFRSMYLVHYLSFYKIWKEVNNVTNEFSKVYGSWKTDGYQ